MEIKFKGRIVLVIISMGLFCNCEIADVGGMFISGDSVEKRFRQSMEWNENHPVPEIIVTEDDYSIWAMGDSHVGGTDNLTTFFDSAIASNIAAVVMAGDLTSGNKEDYITFGSKIPPQSSLVSFPIAGNHDLYFDGWQHYVEMFGTSSYIFTVKTPAADDLYICLDTGGATLGPSQLKWFKDILENKRPSYRRCIVITHNNLFRIRRTTSTTPQVEELSVLIELFAKHSVDLAITGHDHKKNVVEFGGTVHVTMDALKDGLEYAGYFKLNIASGILGYSFVDL